MILIDPLPTVIDIDSKDCFIIVDKDKNPELFKKSIILLMNTQQARIIRDYLDGQINECPIDNIGIGLILHTGLNG